MNAGGNDALAFKVATRFFDQSRTFGYVRYRQGSGHDDFTPAMPRTGAPSGAWQFTKPMLLLTGRGCFSSTESFTLALGALPNVTVVGDTTGGGTGNPMTFTLAGAWTYSLPRWIEYDSDMRVIEWSGIAPDRVIPASVTDFDAGRDPVIEFARAWASAR
jgi:C-terminal processing protease CtpA/Prc